MENITKKIISEKDKVTTIVQKEPAEGEFASSKIIQTKDEINSKITVKDLKDMSVDELSEKTVSDFLDRKEEYTCN